MPKANLSIAAGELSESSRVSAAAERREPERLITEWEQETRRLGHALALLTLDVSAMTGPRWAYRFIIGLCPTVEDASLLFYGTRFAALVGLPERPDRSLRMTAQLPARYVPVFTQGCINATLSSVAVRMQGAVGREDGRQELYRAAFIRLSLDANRLQQFVLGAFNCHVAERRT